MAVTPVPTSGQLLTDLFLLVNISSHRNNKEYAISIKYDT